MLAVTPGEEDLLRKLLPQLKPASAPATSTAAVLAVLPGHQEWLVPLVLLLAMAQVVAAEGAVQVGQVAPVVLARNRAAVVEEVVLVRMAVTLALAVLAVLVASVSLLSKEGE